MTNIVLCILMFAALMAIIGIGGWFHARGDTESTLGAGSAALAELERRMEAKYGSASLTAGGRPQAGQKARGLTRAELERAVNSVPPGERKWN